MSGCMSKDAATEDSFNLSNAPSSKLDMQITDQSGAPTYIKVGSANTFGGVATTSANNVKYQPVDKKIIKSGSLSLDVVDLDKVSKTIYDLVSVKEGYIQSSSRHDYDNYNRLNMQIRVPVADFKELYDSIAKLGDVTLDETNSQDVTEQYFDLEIRLSSLNVKKESLTKLFDKAKNVSEILQIENELNRVIYEIESVKGRLQYFDRNVAMSSISLSIFERNPASTIEKNNIERLKFALKDGWGSMLNFMIALIAYLIWLIPFAPIILLALYLLRKIWLLFKKKRALKKSRNNDNNLSI